MTPLTFRAAQQARHLRARRRSAPAWRRIDDVPRYEYRCRACGDTFERSRPMSESSAPCACPQGHDDTVRLLSTISVGGRASTAEAGPGGGGGGGCCGG